MKVSEQYIQIALYNAYGNRWIRAYPNMYFYEWESDLLTVTQHRYAVEFEIKITYADFKADFSKSIKHKTLATGINCPSRFFYVVPYGIINSHDLPIYAGLIEWRRVGNDFYFDELIKAPKLHSNKVKPSDLKKMDQKLYYKYWSLLNKIDFG